VLGAGGEVRVARAVAVELDLQPQVVDRVGVAQRVFVGDHLAFVEVEQRLVEGLHAELAAALHQLLDLGHLALEDQVGDQRRVEQHLDRRDAALALLARQQALRDQALEVERQVHQQLCTPLLGEEVDDAVERLVGAVGVQRGHAEVAGLGEGDGVLHRLAVADFAHQDHVGRLAQRVLQRRRPVVGVDADLALRDDAVLVRMHELDRVLDRDDVAVGVLVAVVDHRRQRGALARAGGADEDHEAALGQRHVLEDLRQAERVDRRDLRRDRPHHDADMALLHEGVAAEAADAGRGDREVALLGLLELGRLLVVHDRARQRQRVLRRQRLRRDLGDAAVDLDRGRKVGRQEEVGAVARDQQAQQVVDELRGLVAFHGGLPSCCVMVGRAALRPPTAGPTAGR
jgi:hypothetical protein